MTPSEPSVFSKIIAGEIPADVVYDDERFIAFHDIAPQAPVHILVVPKIDRYRNVSELAESDPQLLADLVGVARRIADEHAGGEFRLIFNTGPSAGQTIFHVHAHVLGGQLEEGTLAR